MERLKFAAFVMTYERPEILLKTIKKLKAQSFPPELIMVVDNSNTRETESLLINENLTNLKYFRVGYNSGPAGASKIGLKTLSDLGYQWIYWGDDDNPPRDNSVFEHLFEGIAILQNNGIKLGVFGGKGGKFNKFSGRIKSLSNKELKQNDYVAVDSVPGGHTMLVNSQVVKAGALPNEDLFFGFEEFDFCLKVKNRGFKIFVDSKSWLQVRKNASLDTDNYRWKGSSFGNKETLNREFYSTRNLLSIFKRNGLIIPLLILISKSIGKMVLGFRYGYNYGTKMMQIQYAALRAFFIKDFTIIGKPD